MNLRDAIKEQLGVREVPGTDEWPTKCFSPDHDDNKPSASINVAKGLWVCYSCGRGGSVEALLNGIPIADPSAAELVSCVEANLRLAEAAGHTDKCHYSESWLRIYRSTTGFHPYWSSRGFSEPTIEHFNLGYDYETDCVTYPLRDVDGSVLGVVRRRLDDGLPKYRYPTGINIHDLLFRYHEAAHSTTLVLVEGALDAIALHEAGIFALALFGSNLSPSQEHLIIRLNPSLVISAGDNDEAGQKITQQLIDSDIALVTHIKGLNWHPYLDCKDVAELLPEQRKKIIEEAIDLV